MPLLSHTTAGAGGSGRLLESQPEGGKEHCEPIPPAPSADHDEAVGCLALWKQVRSVASPPLRIVRRPAQPSCQ